MVPVVSVLLAMAARDARAAPSAAAPAPARVGIVFCAPGYPGTTAEAQPRMDELAAAIAEVAGWPRERVTAVYHPTEKAGLARLAEADAAIALVPLPFLLQHEKELKLTPRLAVAQKGGAATEAWTLVAKKGRVKAAADLEGWKLFSSAGYAPAFVRGAALGGFGPLPASTKLLAGGQVLSSLRKAATGEDMAALLDATQAASLSSLPFAAELEVVRQGPALPSALVATVGARLPEAEWKTLAAALAKLSSAPRGVAALEGVQLAGFVSFDKAALEAARKAFTEAAR